MVFESIPGGAEVEALRADGEGAAAGGADQEEPGGEAEEAVTNPSAASVKTRGVMMPALDPDSESDFQHVG